jgi:hypothetical protein
VLTQLFLGEEGLDEIGDKLHANSAHNPDPGGLVTTTDKRLKFSDYFGWYFWEEVGRLWQVPDVLRGLSVEQVILRQQTALDGHAVCLKPGPHMSDNAEAYVEHTVPPSQNPAYGNVQRVVVNGATLEAANALLDALPQMPVQNWTYDYLVTAHKYYMRIRRAAPREQLLNLCDTLFSILPPVPGYEQQAEAEINLDKLRRLVTELDEYLGGVVGDSPISELKQALGMTIN